MLLFYLEIRSDSLYFKFPHTNRQKCYTAEFLFNELIILFSVVIHYTCVVIFEAPLFWAKYGAKCSYEQTSVKSVALSL